MAPDATGQRPGRLARPEPATAPPPPLFVRPVTVDPTRAPTRRATFTTAAAATSRARSGMERPRLVTLVRAPCEPRQDAPPLRHLFAALMLQTRTTQRKAMLAG